jgi:hypothetical protein
MGMRLRLWTQLVGVLALALVRVTPGAAQQAPVFDAQAPGVGAWAPGPAASGDRYSLAGVIDAPTSGASVLPGNLQLAGWFVDLSAQGWAGADDVEIFAGSMDEGGRPLGHAQFTQDRPDVAESLNNPFWAQSGWSASISTSALPAGPHALWVYVHTPAKGWWQRRVDITIRPPPTPTPGAPGPVQPTPTPVSKYGNDISYPQCPTGAEPPRPAFAIVGVTGGRPFSANPCLPRQFVWALTSTSPNQAHVGFYMNTANPGPTASTDWPAAGTSTPRACDGSWSADCAYDYGWLTAQDAYSRVVGVVGNPAAAQYPWWLDVESANSWSDDTSLNAADLEGVMSFLRSQNVGTIGIYSTAFVWEALIGPPLASASPFGGLLNWGAGAADPLEAPAFCSLTVTGGQVKFVQFPYAGFDTDLACF